ncbi:G-protein coupled receptor 22-like [Tubulanus polymorphus]|uniref:G-protein coupled receptor 22-like n=1 Tax=Tubulanus polymorphus TaxID=672921 RepID=UPI003DA5608B
MTLSEIDQEYAIELTVPLAVVLMIENAIGLFLNLTVLIVDHFNQRSMKSPSNLFITNLNVVDIVICLTSIPLTFAMMVTSRIHGRAFCYCHEATISFASTASVVNLLVITLDRYDTIITPMKRRFTPTNSKFTVVFIWGLSIFGFVMPFIGYNFSSPDDGEEITKNHTELPCYLWFQLSHERKYYYELYYAIFYVFANVAIIVCYCRIYHEARSRLQFRSAVVKATFGHLQKKSNLKDNSMARSQEKRVTKMTLIIVSTFMVCWGPHAILSIISVVEKLNWTLEVIQLCFLALAFSTTILHPLVYVFMRQNFRKTLRSRFLGDTVRVSPQEIDNAIQNITAPAKQVARRIGLKRHLTLPAPDPSTDRPSVSFLSTGSHERRRGTISELPIYSSSSAPSGNQLTVGSSSQSANTNVLNL